MNAILLKTPTIPKPERPKKINRHTESAEMTLPYHSIQANVNDLQEKNSTSSELINNRGLNHSDDKMGLENKKFTKTPIKYSKESNRRRELGKAQLFELNSKNRMNSHESTLVKDGGAGNSINLKKKTFVHPTNKVNILTTEKGNKKTDFLITASDKKKTIRDFQNNKTNKLSSNQAPAKNEKSVTRNVNRSDSVIQKRLMGNSPEFQKNEMGIIKSKIKSSQSTLLSKMTGELTIAKSLNQYQNTLTPVSKVSSVGLVKRVSEVIIQSFSSVKPNSGVYKVNGGELGDIEIKLFQEQAATKATIVVSTESAKSSMEKLHTAVKDNLLNKGIKLESFNVEVNSGGENKSHRAKTSQRKLRMSVSLEDEAEVNTTRSHIREYGYNTIEIVA